MAGGVLVLNAGSSSLKFSLFAAGAAPRVQAAGAIEDLEGQTRFHARGRDGAPQNRDWTTPLGHDGALAFLLDWLATAGLEGDLIAAGHRVVHGGERFVAPVRIDAATLDALQALVPLAPLHQPHNLRPIRLLQQLRPALPQVACFDTAFHHTMPEVARDYALPPDITRHGVRRYGFHGLSYDHIASVLPTYDPPAAAGRTIVLHLGNGASMCALLAGRSVATTMGLTALDGLMMGTRCGSLDPGVVLYMLDALGMDARAIEATLYHRSGLLGVSGLSSDMRDLLASDDPLAARAVALFVHRISLELGALAAALGGLHAIVFTAGIGEHAAAIRAQVCERAGWLGVKLDGAANASGGPRISAADSAVAAWVIPADEELTIARQTCAVLGLS